MQNTPVHNSLHLSFSLSLHPPAILITTYHYVAYQRQTGAGCMAGSISITVDSSLRGLKGIDTFAHPLFCITAKNN